MHATSSGLAAHPNGVTIGNTLSIGKGKTDMTVATFSAKLAGRTQLCS
jgi:hypothetical protein